VSFGYAKERLRVRLSRERNDSKLPCTLRIDFKVAFLFSWHKCEIRPFSAMYSSRLGFHLSSLTARVFERGSSLAVSCKCRLFGPISQRAKLKALCSAFHYSVRISISKHKTVCDPSFFLIEFLQNGYFQLRHIYPSTRKLPKKLTVHVSIAGQRIDNQLHSFIQI